MITKRFTTSSLTISRSSRKSLLYSLQDVISDKFNRLIYNYLIRSKGWKLWSFDWNQRFYNHKKSIKNKSYRNDITFSSYLWDLTGKHNDFPTLTWSVIKSVSGYSNISKQFPLCLTEKVLIATYEKIKNCQTRDWN